MKPEQSQPVKIPAAEVGEIALWKLPEMEAGFVERALHREVQPSVTVVEEEIVAEKVTLAELEKIHEGAYQDGFAVGQKDGFEQGHQEGVQQGLEQGLAAGQARIDARLEQLDQLLQLLQRPIVDQESRLEQHLVRLALNLAESVVKSELRARQDLLQATISEALALLPQERGMIRLFLHPDDCERFADLPGVDNLTLIDDATLTPGGCRVESTYTQIDFTLEQRFADVARQLLLRLESADSEIRESE